MKFQAKLLCKPDASGKQGSLDPFAFVEKKNAKAAPKSEITLPQVPALSSAPAQGANGTGTVSTLTAKKPLLAAHLVPTFNATVLASSSTTRAKLTEELMEVFTRLMGEHPSDKTYRVSRAVVDRQITETVTKLKKVEALEQGTCWEIIKKQE